MSWETLTEEQRRRIETGDFAMKNLRRTESVERWREVGIAYNELQAAAMAAASTNQPVGVRYNAFYARLLEHAPHLRTKDPRGKNVDGVDKATKAHAMWLAREWDDIERWRETLPTNIRMQMVHPTTIRRRWDAAHRVPSEGDRKPSPRLRLQDQVVKLTEQLDHANKRKPAEAIPPEWTPGDLVKYLRDRHDYRWLEQLGTMCMLAAKEARQAKRPTAKAKAKPEAA